MLKLKLNEIAIHDKSSQSYEASLAVRDHTDIVPPGTRELAPPNPSQKGWYSIYLPRRDGRLSNLLHTEMVYPPADGHPSKY